MPQPTEQQLYETLCAEEQRAREQFVSVRDSGKASIDVIAEHHKRFNDAIVLRSNHKRKFPHVKEPHQVWATVQTNFKLFNQADVNASLPWLPLKGKLNEYQHDDQ
jgi:hypothetical protein